MSSFGVLTILGVSKDSTSGLISVCLGTDSGGVICGLLIAEGAIVLSATGG